MDLKTKACRFTFSENLEFDEYSGVTTNAAESVNAVLAREIKGPVTVTQAALILYNLSLRFDYDINCGMALIGKAAQFFFIDKSFSLPTFRQIHVGHEQIRYV